MIVHAVGREVFTLFYYKGYLAVPTRRKSKEQFRPFLFYCYMTKMTKLISIIIVCLTSSTTITAKDGDKFTENGIRYQVISEIEKTCQVGWGDKFSNYTKATADNYTGDIVIPTHAANYKVVSVNDMAFRVLNNVTSVSIPYTVSHIGNNAFYNSKNLKTIIINCCNLDNSSDPFKGNNIIQNIVLGDSVKTVGLYMFQNCQGLSSITFGKNIKEIYPLAFAGCTSLKTIRLPESLEEIMQEAFSGCNNLQGIDIPASVKFVAINTFSGCTKLKEVNFKSTDKTLQITTTTNSSTKNIIMFKDCPLETIYLGRDIYLGNANYSPFYSNKTLKRVILGTLVTELPKSAFLGCNNLESCTCELIFDPKSSHTTTTQLRYISYKAFSGCTSLQGFVIPSSVTKIEEGAFQNCTSLNSITIPEGMKSIGNDAFNGCGISSISIPKKVEQIGNYAFANCKLKEIEIQDRSYSDKCSLGYGVFQNCELLESAHLRPSMTIDRYTFNGCKSLKDVQLPTLIREIPDGTFRGCANLIGINLSSENKLVSKIGREAFKGCEKLEDIKLLNDIEEIGNSAFSDCKSINKIILPSKISVLSAHVFENCSSLESIKLPDSLRTIENNALAGCSSLTALTIPNSVTNIGKDIVTGCINLKELICFSSSYIDNVPNHPCVALVSPAVISKYNMENVRPIVYIDTKQASVIVKSTDDFSLTSANQIQSAPVMVENGQVILYGLAPKKTQKIHLNGTAFGRMVEGDIDVTTLPIQIDINVLKSTNLTLLVRGVYDSGDADVTDTNFGEYGTGSETTITGLYPGQSISVTFNVTTSDGSTSSITKWLQTQPVTASVSATATSSSCTMKGSYSVIDATVESSGFKENNYTADFLKLNGLDPNRTYSGYTYYVNVKEGGSVQRNVSFSTKTLSLKTQQPKVISVGNVIVAADTNLDDEEENVGFEWRRTDWTNEFASNTGTAALFEGRMEGYIRNLNTEKLWKVRPYYLSNSGIYYYGDWMGLDPTNTSYFEPTVHTYAKVNVDGNTALIKGYALRGTDGVKVQGFKYWKQVAGTRGEVKITNIPANAKTVEASGQVMTANLTDLDYESDYCYVAFVTTTEGESFYGELQMFKTGEDITGIEDVTTNQQATVVAIYNLNGRRIDSPQHGLNILRMSDGTTRKVMGQ
jgi:hypothetical protein